MKVGDYIKLKEADGSGVIRKLLSSTKIEVEMENGFVIKVANDKVELSEPPIPFVKKGKKKPSISIPPPKVDLHIEQLLPNHRNMSNFDIVQFQLNEFEKALDGAIACDMLEITFVHGIGAGVLRSEIRKRLGNNKQIKSFMDAHYDRGATIVKFY